MDKHLANVMNTLIRNGGRGPVDSPPAAPPSAGTCTNLKAARAVANNLGMVDNHGEPDWARVALEAPELFAATSQVPNAHAGAGTGAPPPAARTVSQRMNSWIRKATGHEW